MQTIGEQQAGPMKEWTAALAHRVFAMMQREVAFVFMAVRFGAEEMAEALQNKQAVLDKVSELYDEIEDIDRLGGDREFCLRSLALVEQFYGRPVVCHDPESPVEIN